jgi:hypothetical protein
MVLISVRGIPGSGKTFIARKLRGVRCIDTDDVVSAAYDELDRARAREQSLTVDDVLNRAQSNLDAMCRKLRALAGVTVVVGVTLVVSSPDSTLFIAMSPKAARAAYERTVRREVAKYASVSPRSVSAMSADRVAPYLACKLHVNAFDPRREFSEYAEMYASAFEFERNNGARMMSQQEIVSYVRRLEARFRRHSGLEKGVQMRRS